MRLRLMGDNISQLRMFHSQPAAEKKTIQNKPIIVTYSEQISK
jgi:hypothetical protein